jgi:hypothetical protein
MLAYANPADIRDERQRGDGYGLVRFDKRAQRITLECWPRFADAKAGDKAQFPGWPITVKVADNDGRKPVGYLPELEFKDETNAVVQVIAEASGEILYTTRVSDQIFQPAVFAPGKYTIKVGKHQPTKTALASLEPKEKSAAGKETIEL